MIWHLMCNQSKDYAKYVLRAANRVWCRITPDGPRVTKREDFLSWGVEVVSIYISSSSLFIFVTLSGNLSNSIVASITRLSCYFYLVI